MKDRYCGLPVQVALPVYAGQVLFDWSTDGAADALGNFPLRAGLIVAIALAWSLVRKRQKEKSRGSTDWREPPMAAIDRPRLFPARLRSRQRTFAFVKEADERSVPDEAFALKRSHPARTLYRAPIAHQTVRTAAN
ncbi:hypothetical protein [Sphingosinicella sp. BN140058]|uniref:hypothetical protein n=1 Tax=Sphingosinicella sp. BN140058 TaxID=1892855 RepID=UPI0010124676|nr:hypothetical protein [Sphingosinicella sp. BN140058]QAY78915.1 hypothetical protein ETR14_22025 [Sphingosinicella sp. BN140058]